MKALAHIKARLGELWWYTAVFFIVQRLGDAINAFIGVWLVPKYVPQEELGALLPLAQVGTIVALPLGVLSVTFTKYVNVFATRGELGKVKRLLRDTFSLSAALFVVIMLYARLFMPLVFERMRVADGRLGMLVVASGVLATLSGFFNSAVQALKMFRFTTLVSTLGAPLRLVTLLVCLPIRALSGYFVGQIVPMLYGVAASLFGLRSLLFGAQTRSTPYLASDGPAMLRFAIPMLIGSLCFTPKGLVEAFVIRHRLPDIDSAAFYIISRFAEMGTFVGSSMIYVLFPMASEQHERGSQSQRLLLHGLGGTLGTGTLLAVFFLLTGTHLFRFVPAGGSYQPYIPHLALLTFIMTLRTVFQCFMMHEIACHRFGFYWWMGAFSLLDAAFLYAITGFAFFAPWVPGAWIEQVAALRPARLEFVLGVMTVTALLPLAFMTIYLLKQRRSRQQRLSD